MVASVPDNEPLMLPRNRRCRAYQFAADPESADMIASSGSRDESSQKIRIGLTGSASTMASDSMVAHHDSMFCSMPLRHVELEFCSTYGNSARRVAVASPTRLTSVG